MVDIYLPIEDRQILALSIPFVDIERLSLCPVKWLRFLLFTICGVRGDLATTPNGPPVDYDTSTLDDIGEAYYFIPEGDYRLIDFHAMDSGITSTAQTPRSLDFRGRIMERDGSACVFTRMSSMVSQAAHLLPKSKGDGVYILVAQRHRLVKCSLSTFNSFFKIVSIFITSMKNPLI